MKLNEIPEGQEKKYVGLLTEQQKDSLVGQSFEPDSYFHPIQDVNDNWIISIQEMSNCINIHFVWVKDLDVIIYESKPTPESVL